MPRPGQSPDDDNDDDDADDDHVGYWTRDRLLRMDRNFTVAMCRALGLRASPPSALEHLKYLLRLAYRRELHRRQRTA